ncbi:UNVERIFIED_CONTAM: hypothetical protein ABIC26_004817 [Paenibacillus sp. PvR008]
MPSHASAQKELKRRAFNLKALKVTEQEWLSGLSRALEAERWITDGFMQKSIPLRLQLADIIIFLDLSAFVCLWSALKRGWMNLLGRTAPRLIYPSSCSIYGDSPEYPYSRPGYMLYDVAASRVWQD